LIGPEHHDQPFVPAVKPLEILSFEFYRHDVRLRMPFRYSIATMTEGPVVFVRLRVADGGREV